MNLRFMYLMEHETPSYRTFGYFINEVIADSIEEIFNDINKKIFEIEHVDLQHLYIDGSKFEANANKYSWVWKKATEKSRYRLFNKITSLFEEINEELSFTGTSHASGSHRQLGKHSWSATSNEQIHSGRRYFWHHEK